MRTRLVPVLGLLLALAPARAADDAKAARATLDRAIKAMGGEKLLAAKALSGTSRGTAEVVGIKATVTNEWTVQGLDQFKWVTEAKINENTAAVTLVLKGDKAWLKGNANPSNPLTKEQTKALAQGFAGLRIAESLLPLT